jgi:hypothetical protein
MMKSAKSPAQSGKPKRSRDEMLKDVAVGPSYGMSRLPRCPSKLRELTQPHVESFNYFLEEVLNILASINKLP